MKLLIPSADTPVSFSDVFNGFLFSFSPSLEAFGSVVKSYTNKKYCFFTNSGTTAFYVILRALRRLSGKTEVIIPAYTAPSLIPPIKRAGLKPVLCDISLKTFTIDIPSIAKYINENTLCIMPVHQFGLPVNMEAVMNIAQQRALYVVENAAPSFGTTMNKRPAGTFGDIGFYSFNRGKNLSTFSGGCIITDAEEIARAIETECSWLPDPGFTVRVKNVFKSLVLTLATRPFFYTLFYYPISQWKHGNLHTNFDSFRYTEFQAGIGNALFKHAPRNFNKRYDHGLFLLEMLSGVKGVRLPELIPDAVPVFNQFPVLFDTIRMRENFLRKINTSGIESTVLYSDPVHKIYDLGYDTSKDPFPNATYFSRRLLLIPTHPMMDIEKLSTVVTIIKTGLEELTNGLIFPSQL
ncbi:MAG: DegT/DnrJ/EryC1/StrS family aminotransferase [Candidatus Loosdrechtia sp.]|uniref:DegT/DnrJ/EryC1/StrS family aminotransferase n=1 Tax=Candidatus Loosdrechtia sp. TaxID=3101272 RepID=UPI003A61A6CF|nr:MAG: DegT/DnrJ/EryC1/StrS family aminotransferase [Candidatus Jettenia sp. AMX2]